MKKLLLLITICLSLSAQSQDSKILVADETYIIRSGISSFRIVTVNEKIQSEIFKQYSDSTITRYTAIRKKDRMGYYWETSIYFKNEDYQKVFTFIRKLND